MEKLIFRNRLAIGDNLAFTTALRELHEQYPEKYQTGILSFYPEVYENNPYVTNFTKEEAKDLFVLDVNYTYEYKHRSTSGKHMAQGYVSCLNQLLNIDIYLSDNTPNICLTPKERTNIQDIMEENNITSPFWLVAPAIKPDIPLKNYSAYNWQKFASAMQSLKVSLIQTGDNIFINPKLKNVISLVGKLNLREYFALAEKAKGMIGHVSLQTHVAAAFDKPCITVNGGRESIGWSGYTNQQTLHTTGMLECCKKSGCWLKTIQDCHNFDYVKGISGCMKLIDVNHIVDLVLKYEGIKK